MFITYLHAKYACGISVYSGMDYKFPTLFQFIRLELEPVSGHRQLVLGTQYYRLTINCM
jgi:hypothetical protein